MPNTALRPWTLDLPDEVATARLGEALALMLRPGDVVGLSGDLGAGKSTLARALLRAFADAPSLDVPSPTFTLVQPYDGPGFRFPVLHADLYRVEDAAELDELGLDEALSAAAVLVEWPDRGNGRLPAGRIDVRLETIGAGRVAILTSADPGIARRIARAETLWRFLAGGAFRDARRRFLQGDASPRAYERLTLPSGASVVLLDAAAAPDRPATPERRAYMAATHLAPNDDVRPILAIGAELARRGFSVPNLLAASVPDAILILEDLGGSGIVEACRPIPERYRAAVEALAAMHGETWPEVARASDGIEHTVPRYSRTALETEAGLLLDKFLPAVTGHVTAPEVTIGFRAAWDGPFRILEAAPRTLTLFDFHSPNILWLDGRIGPARVGLLDFQDARFGPEAYDVVSLAQDARIDVPPELEEELVAAYLAARPKGAVDLDAFHALYAICGAQRASRILGVFARLAQQDGKPHYLRHVPRISGYLDRCLAHPVLDGVRRWYDVHAPPEVRLAFAARAA